MELSRQDCNAMKGLAMIFIFIHNYCHLLPIAPPENEFVWSGARTDFFWEILPKETFVAIFSFLGHYGVVVFIFLTGFGLAKKYKDLSKYTFWGYIRDHYLKLIKLLLPGLLSYMIVSKVFYGWFDGMRLTSLICQLFFVNNLMPTMYYSIVPGVYWYFGLTMQLYVIFYFINHNLNRILSFTIVCVLITLFSFGHDMLIGWIKCNFIGSALPFAAGQLFAKNDVIIKFKRNTLLFFLLAVCSLFLLLYAEFSFYAWIFISIPVICLFFFVVNMFSGRLFFILSSVGAISHLIFVIHPSTRSLVRWLQATYDWSWQFSVMFYIIFTLLLSFFVYKSSIIKSLWKRIIRE